MALPPLGPAAAPRCFGARQPRPEECDVAGLDTNCDGQPDDPDGRDLVERGQPCGSAIGRCRPGMVVGCNQEQLTAGALNPHFVCSADFVPPRDERCNGTDDDCDGELPAGERDSVAADRDGDGWMACSGCTPDDLAPGLRGCGDCGPRDARVYPGAPEVCDGIDDDCDTVVPEPELDPDGDDYITCGPCSLPLGPGLAGCGDCVPDNRHIHPGATEVCDGWDNTCDGVRLPGEDDPDGDGYLGCAPCGPAVAPGVLGCGDCQPSNPAVNPAAAEACNGVDDDCNRETADGADQCGSRACCPATGGCVDTGSDPRNCGGCGVVCPANTSHCVGGRCLCGASLPCGPGLRCAGTGAAAACQCDTTSCTGCCLTAPLFCHDGTVPTACGAGGRACVACDPALANRCAAGECRCGSGPPCGAGQRCAGSGATASCICDGVSCPGGCCAGANCQSSTDAHCGRGGRACAACGAGQYCAPDGSCACSSASCTTGCCDGDRCRAQDNGHCGLRTDCEACAAGQACNVATGRCACTAASCAGGCCDGTTCRSPSAGACGTGGGACVACAAGQGCVGGACACTAASCASGCCDGTTCRSPSDRACGTGGAACVDCPTGQRCVAGSCTP
jgi:hypothetical protein